ncbi:MAG: hypothetical protein EHM48_02735, partial [Planctomycetaceae bacterium]
MAGVATRHDSDLFIEYALRMTKGRIRLVSQASAVLLMLAVAATMLLAMVLADHLIPHGLSDTARLVLRWLIVAVEVAMGIVMIILPLGRRISDLYVARLIEKAHPAFRNDLTAALLLEKDANTHRGPLMAIRRRAAKEVSQTNVEGSVTTRRVKHSGILLAISAGLFLTYCIVSPKSVTASLMRAMGGGSVDAPTRTQITDVEPGPQAVVLAGQQVAFSASVTNGSGPVMLKISRNAGKTFLTEDTQELLGATDGSHRYTGAWTAAAEEGQAAFEISCGDAISKRQILTVLPTPAIRQMKLSLTWPEYSGRGVTESTGMVEALPGTSVSIEAQANLAVGLASVVFEKADNKPVQMQVADADLKGVFIVRKSNRYRIEFNSSRFDGIKGASIWYDVKSLEDRLPVVSIVEPRGRVELAVNDQLKIGGEISDDFGLAEINLVYEGAGGLQRLPLMTPLAAPGQMRKGLDVSLPVAKFGQAGQQVICHVEAKDFCPMPDGTVGQTSKSETFVLVIKSPDEQIASQAKAEEDARRQQEEQA